VALAKRLSVNPTVWEQSRAFMAEQSVAPSNYRCIIMMQHRLAGFTEKLKNLLHHEKQ